MEGKVHGTFVCEKINKVRWKTEDLIDSDTFITGSWDNETNHIAYWLYPSSEDESGHTETEIYPSKLAEVQHEGDVTEIKFINNTTFVASSSSGSVNLYRIDRIGRSIREISSWDKLHSCEVNGLSCFEEDIATVCVGGQLILLTARHKKPVRRFEEADSCSLRTVCFLKHNEVLTGNLRGQMKVWDLKSSVDKPASTFMLSGEQIGASCVTHHPTQCHLVLAGGEDGSLTVWDLRQNTFPVTLLSAHSDTVSELHFHPDRPEHVFTCSTSGEIWHWDTSSMSRTDENPWLNTEAAKHRLEVFTLMPQLHKPINSLDINRNRVVCGCDNEAVYVFKNVML